MIEAGLFTLDDIYCAESGRMFMTGIQALVRLPLMQRRLDRHRGLSTAGLISGYRGSPLGTYDQQLWKAHKYLVDHEVVFQPALNEDLAATALWGAQMHAAFGPAKVDGVFGIWYGKGNGVDRTGDAFRNANVLGTSALGGVLAVAGDDHAAQSSMFPHQTDGILQSVMMPVLQPASVADIIELGLAGIALSRYSGLWVGMKTIAEVVESAASFELPDPCPDFVSPEEFVPPHGLNWDPRIAWPAQRAEYERRMIEERLPAVIGWAAANRLDRPVWGHPGARLCVVTVGKAHQDLMQALAKLGIGADDIDALGISIYKVVMSWPLATAPLFAFARGAEEICVVEEKAGTVEDQIKAALFNQLGGRVRVTGKMDREGRPLLSAVGEFTPFTVAEALVSRLADAPYWIVDAMAAWRVAVSDTTNVVTLTARRPFFCSGCPHNSSTKVPEGSVGGGGIGCHIMALTQPTSRTSTFTQMGGEGAQWIGAAPFSTTDHIFQNIGDGTYQHSGLLAIRAAVAAQTNITFKILHNDAVAMTGGQPAEGTPTPSAIAAQLLAEGVGQVHLVSDDPGKWHENGQLPAAVTITHRDRLDAVQRDLREVPGVTGIIYEQTCAAEKRRRRKRGVLPDPDRRLFINPRVCEGCGDCSAQSSCIAVEPLPTGFGTKRKINQSSCNKDFSCVKGFCPSFVEIDGPMLRKPDDDRLKAVEQERFAALPPADICTLDDIFNIYVAGIGGLGVLTVGALLGTAAHLDGKVSTVLDFTGLAQKNGAVVSQVRIGAAKEEIRAVRIGLGEIDLLLATDLVVAAAGDTLGCLSKTRSRVVLNVEEVPTADIINDRDAKIPVARMVQAVRSRCAETLAFNATQIAEGLFGNNVAANTLIVGYAWQKGLIPLSREAIRAAIEVNGASVSLNHRAFEWGRLAAVDLHEVERFAGVRQTEETPESLNELVGRLGDELVAYQNAEYAGRYRRLMNRICLASSDLGEPGEQFARAVAFNAYKLMAYKDEYEVARLYTDRQFRADLAAQFSGTRKLSVYLSPPILSKIDPVSGRPAKRKFGAWIFPLFGVLKKGKVIRGGWLDPFGHTAERRTERALIEEYFETIDALLQTLDAETVRKATAVAQLPDMIRGYGPVKQEAIAGYTAARAKLLEIAPSSLADAA